MSRKKASQTGKRGMISVLLAIIIMLILVIILSVLSIVLLRDNTVQKDVELKSNLHTMSNALDAAKLYMDTSLEYSIYQACYDNLKNGGIQSTSKYGYAVWSVAPPADDSTFKAYLEASITKNLNLYRGSKAYTFLSDYQVNLPTYSFDNVFVNVDPTDPASMGVVAFGDSNLYTEKTQDTGEYIRLEKDSTLQNQDPTRVDCYGIYRKGVAEYAALSAIVRKALDAIPKQITLSGNENLESKLLTYRKAFNDTVRSGAYGLSETTQDYDVSVYVYQADFKYTESAVNGDMHTLSYTPDAYVKFSITNIKDSQQFPVYDGKSVVMSPLTLEYVANPS